MLDCTKQAWSIENREERLLIAYDYLKSCALTSKQIKKSLEQNEGEFLFTNCVFCIQNIENKLNFKFFRILKINESSLIRDTFHFGCACFGCAYSCNSIDNNIINNFLYYTLIQYDLETGGVLMDFETEDFISYKGEIPNLGYVIPFSRIIDNLPKADMYNLFINVELIKEKFFHKVRVNDPYLSCR